MTHYKLLAGEKCYLSPVQPEDGDAWAAWFNDLDVTIPLGDEAYTVSGLECPARGCGPVLRAVTISSSASCAATRTN